MALDVRPVRGAMLAAGMMIASGAAALAQDGAPTIAEGDACPASVAGLSGAVGTVVGCWCPGDSGYGAVWGSDPYTADSDFCSAALHAGVLPEGGGPVWARIVAGRESFPGSGANGVVSNDYGPWDGAVAFRATGAADGGSGEATSAVSSSLPACPAHMAGQQGLVSCFCSADQASSGPVWGTDIYTEDSSVCRAAVHAGAIGPEGGEVAVITVAGQPEYAGSARNGVTSVTFGAWGASFMFAN